MNIFYLVLFNVLLSRDWATAIIPEGESNLVGFRGIEGSNKGTLLQENSEEESNTTTIEYPVCDGIAPGTRYLFDEVLTNVSAVETITNAFGCCQLCQDTAECQIWNRDRDTGECTLGLTHDGLASGFEDPGFDAGVVNSRIFRGRLTPALNLSSIAPCPVQKGVRYPRGDRVGQGRVRDPVHCCEICRGSNDCRSWYYSASTGRCILNGNVPPAASSSNDHAGGRI